MKSHNNGGGGRNLREAGVKGLGYECLTHDERCESLDVGCFIDRIQIISARIQSRML